MQDQGRYTGDTVKVNSSLGEEIHVRHGQGTYTYANNAFQYSGEWVWGVKHGRGVLSVGGLVGDSSVQSVYEGDFIHGEMSGAGCKRWPGAGRVFRGNFLQGEMHGPGVLETLPSAAHARTAAKCEGNWVRNERSGYGVAEDERTQYQGEYFKDKKHGQGRMEWKLEDTVHEGEWVRL